MPDFDHREKVFEQDIESWMLRFGGYQKGDPSAFDPKLALDKATFLSFIQTSGIRRFTGREASRRSSNASRER